MNRLLRRWFVLKSAGLCALCVVAAAAQQLTLTPFNKSGIYALGEKAGWTATLASGPEATANDYTYTLKKNNSAVITSGKLDLTSGTATIETTLDEPAMLYLEITTGNGGKRSAYGAAVAPTKLQPTAPCPADFDAFWAAKIKLLQSISMNAVVTPGDSGK